MKNVPDLLEAIRVQVDEDANEAAKRVSVANMKGGLINQDDIATYNNFLQSGIPLNKSVHPDLDNQSFTYIIKFIFPIVVPNKAIYLSYSSKLRAKQRLQRFKT